MSEVHLDGSDPAPQLQVEATDTHCHLFIMEGEPDELVEAARAAGVGRLICVGIDAESSRRSRELADGLPGVFASAGIHPHTASDLDASAGAAIEELLGDPRVVAVGETGLDYFRMRSPVEDQQRALRMHCALSRDTGKPLVVHVRDAWTDAFEILEDEGAQRVVLHCFSGDPRMAREAAARGYHCSFAGPVTYPKNEALRKAAAVLPRELLLVETDSPFLPPQPLRGTDNVPANIRFVLGAVAEARGEDLDAVAEATSENARAAFGLPD